MKVNIFGVKIDDLNQSEALDMVKNWLVNSESITKMIFTPNPEMVVAAEADSRFKEILNQADLAIPDGAGLLLSGKIKNRVPGVDFMEQLIGLSAKNGFTVGFLGGKNGVAEKTAERLIKKYPKLKVSFAESGGDYESLKLPKLVKCDILFVALGHRKQEKWIYDNRNKISVKVAMGVGGSFDYLSGEVTRAPQIWRRLGFEWLFRLLIEPWRIKRQLALVRYLWLLISYKK